MTGAVVTNPWTCSTCHHTYPPEFALCPLDATPRSSGLIPLDPMLGEVLGHTYRVVRPLGQGGMARLYAAEHLRIDAQFAAKIIHDDLARDPAQLARFEREARAAGKIRSEHVVRLVDVLRTADGRPCIVTELLDGEDLQAKLDRVGKLAVDEAVPIARQICLAVAAAHAVGVVHRDLKPSNVFICKGGSADAPIVKVFDFGIAKLEDDEKLTRTDAVMGTAAYMAPEQARRAADASPATDVYSVGAILYHMLTGQMPYGNVPAVSRFALLLNEEPARPRDLVPDLPPAVEAVIQHAMARDREARISTAQALDAKLAMLDRVTHGPADVSGHDDSAVRATGELAVRARVARPVAVFVAGASSLALGAWTATLFATLVTPKSRGEHALIAVLALVAAGGLAALHVRSLRRAWRSLPAIASHVQPFAHALIGAVVTAGALALFALGAAAMFAATPVGAGTYVGLVGVAAVAGAGWRTWRLDERLRRRLS